MSWVIMCMRCRKHPNKLIMAFAGAIIYPVLLYLTAWLKFQLYYHLYLFNNTQT